jgi:hypothetical protein
MLITTFRAEFLRFPRIFGLLLCVILSGRTLRLTYYLLPNPILSIVNAQSVLSTNQLMVKLYEVITHHPIVRISSNLRRTPTRRYWDVSEAFEPSFPKLVFRRLPTRNWSWTSENIQEHPQDTHKCCPKIPDFLKEKWEQYDLITGILSRTHCFEA